MANSSVLVGGETGNITIFNNYRKDILDIASGHRHSGAADAGASLFSSLVDLFPVPGVVFESIYQAAYDCFVCVYFTGVGQIQIKTGSTSPPALYLLGVNIGNCGGCAFPVKKDDYWQLHVSSSTSEYISSAYQIRIGA